MPVPRPPPEVLREDDDIECLFNVNDLAFAKVKGFSAWPARIHEVLKIPTCPAQVNTNKLTEKQRKKQFLKKSQYRVEFFATWDKQRVTGENLYFYNANNLLTFRENRFKGKKLTALFLKALDEAAKFKATELR